MQGDIFGPPPLKRVCGNDGTVFIDLDRKIFCCLNHYEVRWTVEETDDFTKEAVESGYYDKFLSFDQALDITNTIKHEIEEERQTSQNKRNNEHQDNQDDDDDKADDDDKKDDDITLVDRYQAKLHILLSNKKLNQESMQIKGT